MNEKKMVHYDSMYASFNTASNDAKRTTCWSQEKKEGEAYTQV